MSTADLLTDNDIVRGLGFVSLYSAYLEEQIDNLLFMLSAVERFTDEEQLWQVSRKIKKAKSIVSKIDFEGRDDLLADLDAAKNAFEERNKIVHGRIYGNFDRPDTLKSGRPNAPDCLSGLSTVASSAKGDNGLSINRVCCTRKTGRWLDPRSGTTASLSSDGRTRPGRDGRGLFTECLLKRLKAA